MKAPTTTSANAGQKGADVLKLPPLLYGTAWKEDETERLTRQALALGFRGIDTANQRKHYVEVAVGAAIAAALGDGLVTRDQLFLQTKFTHRGGQDDRLPYDPGADVFTQVTQSLASSLAHLGTDYVDAYLLHGPSQRHGLAAADREAWRAMQVIARDGSARALGVSNVSREQLEELCTLAGAAPTFVQNRCYASQGWDHDVRSFCHRHGIVYQGFSLLTANKTAWGGAEVARMAKRLSATPAQIIFRLALQLGMLPLTGTSSAAHGRESLAAVDLPPLSAEELASLGARPA